MKIFLAFVAAVLSSPGTFANNPAYEVKISPDRSVKVEAYFPLANDTIFIFMRGKTVQLPEGEAGFVRNLEVKDDRGQVISSSYSGEGNWVLKGVKTGQWVRVQYNLLTTHTNFNWDHVGGSDEAAFSNADGLFFTGYTLFIVPGMELKDITVNFSLPAGWNASTPWETLGERRFKAESARFLLNNCMVLGTHRQEFIRVNGMEMRIAISNKIAYSIPLVKKTMEKLIPAYREMFGGIPAPVYLVAMSEERMTDGSAFRRSFSQIFADSTDEKGMATWAYIMAHEIFHLWNGHAIIPAGQEEWFKEGFTDYMTNVMMRRTGLIDNDILYRKLENMARRYWLDRFWQRDTLSIRETGEHKEQFRFGVYGGGAVAGIALETEMRMATGNRKGVYDLMKAMFSEFGKTGKSYKLEDIIRVVNNLTGKNMQHFFDRYVTGREFLDLKPYLKHVGLDLYTVIEEMYVSPDTKATEMQKEMYRMIFMGE